MQGVKTGCTAWQVVDGYTAHAGRSPLSGWSVSTNAPLKAELLRRSCVRSLRQPRAHPERKAYLQPGKASNNNIAPSLQKGGLLGAQRKEHLRVQLNEQVYKQTQ